MRCSVQGSRSGESGLNLLHPCCAGKGVLQEVISRMKSEDGGATPASGELSFRDMAS